MSLLRFVARSMLASYFVFNGVRALARPEDLDPVTGPLAKKLLPTLTDAAPESLRGFLPTDAAGLARMNGALQIAGGLSLASGIGRRGGATVLAVTTVPHLMAASPLAKGPSRAAARAEFGTNIAVLGGVLLAAGDTEGKPTIAWRLRTQRALLTKDMGKRKAELRRDARAASSGAAKMARRSARQARRSMAEVLS